MKTCATCRFMAADRYGFDGGPQSHNTCVRIIHGNGRMDHPKPADGTTYGEWREKQKEIPRRRVEPAAVLDGSGYAARLVVLPTFGCVLHEEK